MSYDIIILKPADPRHDNLIDVEEVRPIGSETFVNNALESVFPGHAQGASAEGGAFSVEASLSGEPVTSLHLSLRFGDGWSESSSRDVERLLTEPCQYLQASAYAVADNARIAKAG